MMWSTTTTLRWPLLCLSLASGVLLVDANSTTAQPPTGQFATGADKKNGNVSYSSIENLNREEWGKQRAVEILKNVPGLVPGEFWMVPGEVALQAGMDCPTADPAKPGSGSEGPSPEASKPEPAPSPAERRKRSEEESAGSDAGAEGQHPKAEAEEKAQGEPKNHDENARNAKMMDLPKADFKDFCTRQTIAIHRYKYLKDKDPNNVHYQWYVISDLTQALKCNTTTSKCDCLETNATPVEFEGRKVCIKEGQVEKGEECIHHKECKGELLCIFDASGNDEGEIEDTRRYCSASSMIHSSVRVVLLVLPVLVALMR